jgi:hypothetical protein
MQKITLTTSTAFEPGELAWELEARVRKSNGFPIMRSHLEYVADATHPAYEGGVLVGFITWKVYHLSDQQTHWSYGVKATPKRLEALEFIRLLRKYFP